MELPPRDPNEPGDSEPDGDLMVDAPTVVYAHRPTSDEERHANAILAARPGVLFVV